MTNDRSFVMLDFNRILAKKDDGTKVAKTDNGLLATSQGLDNSKVRTFSSIGCQTPLANDEDNAKKSERNDPWAGVLSAFG